MANMKEETEKTKGSKLIQRASEQGTCKTRTEHSEGKGLGDRWWRESEKAATRFN